MTICDIHQVNKIITCMGTLYCLHAQIILVLNLQLVDNIATTAPPFKAPHTCIFFF